MEIRKNKSFPERFILIQIREDFPPENPENWKTPKASTSVGFLGKTPENLGVTKTCETSIEPHSPSENVSKDTSQYTSHYTSQNKQVSWSPAPKDVQDRGPSTQLEGPSATATKMAPERLRRNSSTGTVWDAEPKREQRDNQAHVHYRQRLDRDFFFGYLLL